MSLVSLVDPSIGNMPLPLTLVCTCEAPTGSMSWQADFSFSFCFLSGLKLKVGYFDDYLYLQKESAKGEMSFIVSNSLIH